MDQRETLALWENGKDGWNAWAMQMLSKRRFLEKRGDWLLDQNGKAINDKTAKWLNDGLTTFSTEHSPTSFQPDASFEGLIFPSESIWTASTFHGYAKFNGATFEGEVNFFNARFKGNAQFDSTTFKCTSIFSKSIFEEHAKFNSSTFAGKAWFRDAIFENNSLFKETVFESYAGFNNATFKEKSNFSHATFKGNASFSESTFGGVARFNSSYFDKIARFSNAKFNDFASFNSAQINQQFDLFGASFLKIPDFRQAYFKEAPLLDGIDIDKALNLQFSVPGESDHTVPGKFRALKRLAIQGHDHRNEVEFFAEELRAKRTMVHKRFGWDWWLSTLFAITSDYGRSIIRPFLCWLLLTLMSTSAYLVTAKLYNNNISGECVEGRGWQSVSAIQLATVKGLLLPGIADHTLIFQTYRCLYGGEIPAVTSSILGTQTLLSAAFLFLLMLGIRNHFKLK